MSEPKFPKLIDYAALKQQFGEDELSCSQTKQAYSETTSALHFALNSTPNINKQYPAHTEAIDDQEYNEDPDGQQSKRLGLTGSRLRSYAFAVLTRKEYSKNDLIEKLALYAEHRDEVIELVNELARENYQSDQRLAEMLLASQKRQGKGTKSY